MKSSNKLFFCDFYSSKFLKRKIIRQVIIFVVFIIFFFWKKMICDKMGRRKMESEKVNRLLLTSFFKIF
jgi:hypothetical protein